MLVDDVARAIFDVDCPEAEWNSQSDETHDLFNREARAAIAVVARWLREKEKNFQDCDAQVAIRALAAHIEEGAKG